MGALSPTDRFLGAAPIARVLSLSTGGALRVLAYHGVPEPDALRRQLEWIARHHRPVTGAEVAAAVHGDGQLGRDAVWITFDDGRADVVDAGMAELDRVGVRATIFVCPGLVESHQPYWWDVVVGSLDAAGPFETDGRLWTDRRLVTYLKSVPDARRRALVAELAARAPATPRTTVLTPGHLERWIAAGHEVGNHTWDHPCLDQCAPDEQRRQVEAAHEALTATMGRPPTLFAYPNGDWAAAAEEALVECGYRLALLFDHRLSRTTSHPLRMSRLRLDSDAPLVRARAVLSGGHSAAFHLRTRARAVAGRPGSAA